MTVRGSLLSIVAAAALAGPGLAGCKRTEPPPPPELPAAPPKSELPVEQTPVQSIYEEKPGVLYEKAATTPTVSPVPSTPTVPTPSRKSGKR